MWSFFASHCYGIDTIKRLYVTLHFRSVTCTVHATVNAITSHCPNAAHGRARDPRREKVEPRAETARRASEKEKLSLSLSFRAPTYEPICIVTQMDQAYLRLVW